MMQELQFFINFINTINSMFPSLLFSLHTIIEFSINLNSQILNSVKQYTFNVLS